MGIIVKKRPRKDRRLRSRKKQVHKKKWLALCEDVPTQSTPASHTSTHRSGAEETIVRRGTTGETKNPIDLVWDTSESTDNHSDSDDSSAAVVVTPIDQAAADVSA